MFLSLYEKQGDSGIFYQDGEGQGRNSFQWGMCNV